MNTLLMIFLLALTPAAPQQERLFTPVEGATLQARQEAAARQASAAGQPRFWTAYAFDVRPGVAVDIEYVSDDGRVSVINGNVTSFEWEGARFDSSAETRSLGVFALREAGGAISRLEVFNLARRREYAGLPVYWLGRASNDESLTFLRALAESPAAEEIADDAVRAVALHDDRRVAETLELVARASKSERVRAQAVRSLGAPPVSARTRELLAQLARDEREPHEVRRAAISSAGRGRDAQALALLTGLYDSLTQRELKRTALSWIARNEDRTAAANFLIRLSTGEGDNELRRHAVMRLGEIAGEKALGTLAETAARPDADTELQRHAVVAISRRPAAEAVPLLIKYAQTHARPEIRKQALVLLGRSGDPAAVEFLRAFLTK